MANRRRPPVVPEIAKAYVNDPRTQLARTVIQQGSSTAPVAQGKYGIADGIARVLSGVAGGYMDKQSMDRYADDEADLLAKRQARGVDGLTGAGATTLAATPPAPPPGPPGAPPVAPQGQAAQVAAALGAPPAPPAPLAAPTGAPPPIPVAPVPAPVLGGAPVKRPPFGERPPSGGTTPSWDAPPVLEDIPDAPAPVSRPNAPEAVKPTRSKLLDAAYRIMADANPYESASGQEMYVSGLSDQDKLNEAAAEREQRLRDMGYDADLRIYGDAAAQDRSNIYQDRREAQGRNFQSTENFKERGFRANESKLDRNQRTWETRYNGGLQQSLAGARMAFEREQAAINHGYDMELEGAKGRGNNRATGEAFFNTAAGRKFLDGQYAAINNANTTLGTLSAFEDRMKKTKTGGILLGNLPGAVLWANSDYQALNQLTNQLTLSASKDLKGSISDKDVKFLREIMPSIRSTKRANAAQITQLRGIAQRQREFAKASVIAAGRGENQEFMNDWYAYTESVPSTSGVTFDQFRSRAKTYDRNGNPVR